MILEFGTKRPGGRCWSNGVGFILVTTLKVFESYSQRVKILMSKSRYGRREVVYTDFLLDRVE